MSIIFNFRLPLPTPRFLPPEQSGSGENTQSIILLSNVVKTRLRDLGELLTTLLGVMEDPQTDKGAGASETPGQTKEEFSANDTSRHPKLLKIGPKHEYQ